MTIQGFIAGETVPKEAVYLTSMFDTVFEKKKVKKGAGKSLKEVEEDVPVTQAVHYFLVK